MKNVARCCVKALAILIAAPAFVTLGVLYLGAGTMSVVMVAPGAYWLTVAIFVLPILLGWGLWRLASFLR